MGMRFFFAGLFFLTLLFAVGVPAAQAANPFGEIEIREWTVDYGGLPRDPDAVSNSEVWFVGQVGDYIGRLDPQSGVFFKRDLDDEPGPHNLIVGDDGIVWYAGNLSGYIGRYDPETNQIDKIAMPDPAARDPHTLIFDADNRFVWFTVQNGNFIGRLNPQNNEIDLIKVSTPRARPYGIKQAPDGTLWIALLGTNKLASVHPETLELREHTLPDGARPRRIGITDQGQVFYTGYARGVLGRLDPTSGTIDEWPMPGGSNARPYGMAIDGANRVWAVEGGRPAMFVGFDPTTEKFISNTPIPSGGVTVRHMDYNRDTKSVWFGSDAGTIGQAMVGN
ncbi:MAG: hypothetical protein RIG26_15145 [Thalassospira sp.]|uniref:Vgb family protein n=1 Tax=Thalassospira sp. TaxID=1912094 RepID=UPI0032EB31B3